MAEVLIPEVQQEAIGLKDMVQKLTQIKRNRAEMSGKCPELVRDVCSRTAVGYMTSAAG